MTSPFDSPLRALAVVEFDSLTGQVPRLVVPRSGLSAAEAAKLAYLALPDSNTSVLHDLVYCFRFRTDPLPLFATSAMGHEYAFGCAFFRQQRDPTVARGFVQVGGAAEPSVDANTCSS